MKHLVILAGIMSLLALAPDASADGRRWGGYDWRYDRGFLPAYGYRDIGYFRGGFPRRHDRFYRPYRGPYRRGGSFWRFSYGRGFRHDRFDSGALLGGIVLGSVLGSSIASSRYDTPVTVREPVRSRTRVIRRAPVSSAAPPARRLLRDLSGRCYEITRDGVGTETRIELDPSACNFQ